MMVHAYHADNWENLRLHRNRMCQATTIQKKIAYYIKNEINGAIQPRIGGDWGSL